MGRAVWPKMPLFSGRQHHVGSHIYFICQQLLARTEYLTALSLIFLLSVAPSVTATAQPGAPSKEQSQEIPSAVCKSVLTNGPLREGLRLENPNGTPHKWSSTEIKIWDHLCDRRPFLQKDWGVQDDRRISAVFIKALVASNYFDEPQFDLIHVEHAIVEGEVDLSNETLRSSIKFISCIFTEKVVLDFLSTKHNIDFTNSHFSGGISARFINVSGSVILGFKSDADGTSPPESKWTYISPFVLSSLWKSIDLDGAVIAKNLFVSNLTATSLFTLSGARVGGSAVIHNLRVSSVDIRSSRFRQLDLVNVITSDADGDSIRGDYVSVSGHVFLDRSVFKRGVFLIGANIAGNLSLRGTKLSKLDLTGANISKDLQIGPTKPPRSDDAINTEWLDPKESLMSLDHARVGVFRVQWGTWAPKLQLDGLTFSSIGSPIDASGQPPKGGDADLNTTRIADLASRSTPFSPAVYEIFSNYYQSKGDKVSSKTIGYKKKSRELANSFAEGHYGEALILSLSWAFIGFGYYPMQALVVIVFLTALGALFVRKSTFSPPPEREINPVTYSFDMLLPVIKLRDLHYTLDIDQKWIRRYFYFQKVMGFVLGSFLVAGIAGLAQ